MRGINVKFLIILHCLSVSYQTEINLFYDYFCYKNVSKIVGFGCGNEQNDFFLTKKFNGLNKFVNILSPAHVLSLPKDKMALIKTDYHRLGIFLDLRCAKGNDSGLMFDAMINNVYDEMHSLFILTADLKEITTLLNTIAPSVISDITIAVQSGNDYTLYDFYNPCQGCGGSGNMTFLGNWNEKDRLSIKFTQNKNHPRINLHGLKITAALLITQGSNGIFLEESLLDPTNSLIDRRSKFLYTMLLHMAELYNFTMQVVGIERNEQEDCDEQIFRVLRKPVIDLFITPADVTIDGLSDADIILPVWPHRACFMFRATSSWDMNITAFLRLLSIKVWYTTICILTFGLLFLVTILKLENIRDLKERCGVSLLLIVGAISQQGSTFVPNYLAGRILFLQLTFCGLFILNYYSANLVSVRLKNKMENVNDSLISLADSNLRFGMEPNNRLHNPLTKASNEEMRYFFEKQWRDLPDSEKYQTIEEGLERVVQGGFAYHASIDNTYPYIESNYEERTICELAEVHIRKTTLAFLARRKCPFTEILKVGMLKALSSGLQRRQINYWSVKEPYCPQDILIVNPISLQEASAFFIILICGMTVAVLICVAENIVKLIILR